LKKRYAEACQAFEDCIPGFRRRLGDGSLQLQETEIIYGVCLLMGGRQTEAEKLFERLMPSLKQMEASNPILLLAMAQYALTLQLNSKFTEAEPLWRAVAAGRAKTLPAGHWMLGEAESMLGACLYGQRKFPAAEPLLLSGFAKIEAANNPPAPAMNLIMARAILIQFYENWGKPEKASAFKAKAGPAKNP
jgi:hypothetical protein